MVVLAVIDYQYVFLLPVKLDKSSAVQVTLGFRGMFYILEHKCIRSHATAGFRQFYLLKLQVELISELCVLSLSILRIHGSLHVLANEECVLLRADLVQA